MGVYAYGAVILGRPSSGQWSCPRNTLVQQSKIFIVIENFDIFHTLVTSQVVIYIHAIKHEALESTRSSIKFSAVSITYGKIGSVYWNVMRGYFVSHRLSEWGWSQILHSTHGCRTTYGLRSELLYEVLKPMKHHTNLYTCSLQLHTFIAIPMNTAGVEAGGGHDIITITWPRTSGDLTPRNICSMISGNHLQWPGSDGPQMAHVSDGITTIHKWTKVTFCFWLRPRPLRCDVVPARHDWSCFHPLLNAFGFESCHPSVISIWNDQMTLKWGRERDWLGRGPRIWFLLGLQKAVGRW